MGVIFQSGYSLPGSDEPLTHARIAHSGNWLSGGTVTASGTATDFFSDGPANSLPYERWKPDALPATWEYDHGSAAECDYCVIGAHTMGTNGNTLQVQYWNGSSWTGVISATAITDNGAIYVMFAPQTRQRWRVSITNGTAPEIGVVKFGKALQMQRPIFGGHSPIVLSRQTTMRSNISTSGDFLGFTKQRTVLRSSFDWQYLRSDWVRANVPALQQAVESEPLFIAWRPGDYSEAILGFSDQTPRPQNSGGLDLMSMSLALTGYSND